MRKLIGCHRMKSLFGDEDLEAGKADLNPENSDNINLNLSYTHRLGKHELYVEGSLIYRDTKDLHRPYHQLFWW